MIVNKLGRYRLLCDYKIHQSFSVTNLERGGIITITQIDEKNRKVIGLPLINDWIDWNMPVEIVEEK